MSFKSARILGRLAWSVAIVCHLAVLSSVGAQPAKPLDVVPVPIIGHATLIRAALTGDGRVMVTGAADNTLKVWETATRRLLRSLECHKPPVDDYYGAGADAAVTSVAVARDGRIALSGGRDGAICVWDVAAGRLLRTIRAHKHGIEHLHLTPDGQTIISLGQDDDRDLGAVIGRSPDGISTVRELNLDGGSGTTIGFWNTETGASLGKLVSSFASATPTPDGRALLIAHHKQPASLVEIPSGRPIRAIPEAMNAIFASFQVDGAHLLVMQNREVTMPSVHLIDLATGALKRSIAIRDQRNDREVLAISNDGRLLILDKTAQNDAPYPKPNPKIEVWTLSAPDFNKVPLNNLDFDGSSNVDSAQFSPVADEVVVTNGPRIGVWSASSGEWLRAYAQAAKVEQIAFSPTGRQVLARTTSESAEPMLWQRDSGAFERMLSTVDHRLVKAWFTGGRGDIVAVDDEQRIFVWESANHRWRASQPGADVRLIPVEDDEPQNIIATFREKERLLSFAEVSSGRTLFETKLETSAGRPRRAKVSSQGAYALVLTDRETDGDLLVYSLATKRLLRRVEQIKGNRVWVADFSSDEKWLLQANSKRGGSVAEVREIGSNKLVKSIDIKEGIAGAEFSPGGAYVSISSAWTSRWGQNILRTRDWSEVDYFFGSRSSKRQYRFLDGDRLVLISTGWQSRLHTHQLSAGPEKGATPMLEIKTTGLAPRAYDPVRRRLAIGDGKAIRLFAIDSGAAQGILEGHLGNVSALSFSADGRHLLSGGEDGSVRLWTLEKMQLLTTSLASADEEWITITPEGFFTGSPRALELLSVVRGIETWGINQLWQSLYNPDLVREKIAGDPYSEVAKAAAVVNLDKVVASGAPPKVTLGPATSAQIGQDGLIEAEAQITDLGGGVGRIEWRVNGVTAAIVDGVASAGKKVRTVWQTLALDAGRNFIEVVAYNGAQLVASDAAQSAEIKWNAAPEMTKGRLFVLAIGIDGYTDAAFRPLKLAVNDAKGVAEALKKAGGDHYSDVRVVPVHDGDATRDGIERAVDGIAREIERGDTFILFAAAHGATENGRFYMVPHGYDSATPGGTRH